MADGIYIVNNRVASYRKLGGHHRRLDGDRASSKWSKRPSLLVSSKAAFNAGACSVIWVISGVAPRILRKCNSHPGAADLALILKFLMPKPRFAFFGSVSQNTWKIESSLNVQLRNGLVPSSLLRLVESSVTSLDHGLCRFRQLELRNANRHGHPGYILSGCSPSESGIGNSLTNTFGYSRANT